MSWLAARLVGNAPCVGQLERGMDTTEMKQWLRSVGRLTARQKAELINALSVQGDDAQVRALVESRMPAQTACPHCGGARIVRNGSVSGLQRYNCRAALGIIRRMERPKNGPVKAPGRARRGVKCASLGVCRPRAGASAGLWTFTARRIGPVSGLTLMLAMACRQSAQHHPGCRLAAALGDRYSTARAAQATKCCPASRTRPFGFGRSNPR
jgi:hypothetical protein